MKPFVAVIGSRNAGKSTVISSLTGCPSRTFRGFVADLAANLSIYVIASSPQERPLTAAALTRILNRVAAISQCRGIVMAIQPSRPYRRLSMERIFLAVQLTRAYDIDAFVLDPDYNGVPGIAASVHQRLNPLRIQPHQVDARRFAFVTAAEINAIAGLI